MKSKIAKAFDICKKEKRPALITYTVAGDNTKNNSLKILNKISKHADILECGFPHNTPIADGGQIQGSSHRALKNGIKLKDVFKIVKKFIGPLSLSNVEEIGFTDLMPGGKSSSCSRLDWIEVYGMPVAR